ncbi:MAG: ABC transporter substrate-binding protein, partial [Candidatus Aenigmarchaeota archaeon]|nr:ABC transporter substrate-binding protein [Candidatus Aenigmarchaeota archaeon]
MKPFHIIGILVVLIIIIGGAAVLLNRPISSGETIKIGVSAPLTGEGASFGEGVLGGVELAVKEINDAGGINGRKIEIVVEDDKCSPFGVNAFQKLVNVDKVTAILGPLCSAAGGAALPVAQEAGVPTIEWGSAPHLPKIGDYIFRNYPSDAFQGKFVAEYIFNEMDKRKAAVIYVQNDWGKGINDVFVKTFTELGGQVVFDEAVAQDVRDLRTVITKAKAANPEVVYFPVYPGTGAAGLGQMKELNVNVPIIGGDGFEADEVFTAPGSEGTLFTIAKINNPEEFKARVKSETGKNVYAYTPITYDAVYILAEAMKKAGTNQEAIKNELAKTSYKRGVSFSTIEFDQDGDLKQAEFEIRIIRSGKSEPYAKTQLKIGFLGPLTGDAAVYGLPAQNMVALAAEEINAQGGIVMEIIYEDGKCNGKDGATSMQKLVNVDKVKVVLGGFCSSETLGAEPIATQNKVFLFSLGASSPALTGKSKFFARDYPSDATQGKVLAEVSDSRGWKKVAFIQEQLDYPLGIYNAFKVNFEGLGGTTVKEEFATGTTDFRSILIKLKAENPDALFVDTQTPAAADRIFKQLQELN